MTATYREMSEGINYPCIEIEVDSASFRNDLARHSTVHRSSDNQLIKTTYIHMNYIHILTLHSTVGPRYVRTDMNSSTVGFHRGGNMEFPPRKAPPPKKKRLSMTRAHTHIQFFCMYFAISFSPTLHQFPT